MEVYLVRHGQTDGNVGRRHQHTSTKLNEKGQAQAALVAQKIVALNPAHLITSTNVRAIETARRIAEVTNLIPDTDPMFEELRQPQSMVGERLTGLHAINYMGKWFVGIKTASMHDGETYAVFVSRLAKARAYLEELPADATVVIVSHSVFINFFIEHMVRPKRMGLTRAVGCLFRILTLKNSSITHVRYTKPAGGSHKTGWHLVRGK
jgi:broad specificity phosphatase PhoE